MKFGFSFSPGGLLLPYHVGVMTSLSERGYITDSTPLAGSSAGAIAVAAQGVGIDAQSVVESTIRINKKCEEMGGASGRLLPLLNEELNHILPSDAHQIVNEREGFIGLAFKEFFPQEKNVLQSSFVSRDDFIEAVCNSSMFPFFSTNWPFILRFSDFSLGIFKDESEKGFSNLSSFLPRVVADGYFTVPRDRFGCPEFSSYCEVERTITVSVFPHESIGLTASEKADRISTQIPKEDQGQQLSTLFKRATEVSTEEVVWEMYEEGFADAVRWIKEEETK